ncbi:hypothetical protein [Candidatus Gillettellia adelgis]
MKFYEINKYYASVFCPVLALEFLKLVNTDVVCHHDLSAILG